MFRQYFKQAIQILKENRLTSVISILGTFDCDDTGGDSPVPNQAGRFSTGVEPGQDALYHGDTGRFTG